MYTISQVARLIGVSIPTIRRWDREGKLFPIRTAGGHRRYRLEDVQDWVSESELPKISDIGVQSLAVPYIYARVSTSSQMEEGSLDRQADRLIKFTQTRYGSNCHPIIIKEYGSGLNPKRSGLRRLIKNVKAGRVSAVICAYRDRLSRYGWEFLETLFGIFGVPLIIAEQGLKPLTLLEELLNDFMSLLACFSGKMYKGRSLQISVEERFLRKEEKSWTETITAAIWKAENAAILKMLGEGKT
jgi:excisionase family DNA binding protein